VILDVNIQLRDARWKNRLRPYCKTVRGVCQEAVAATALSKLPCHWEMAVVLADDAAAQELNRTYRGFDKPTNVLSFPAVERFASQARRITKTLDHFEIGDMVLAFETIEREAKEQGKTFIHHAAHLLVHGTLHLLGYDHIQNADAVTMERLEVQVLEKLGVSNPYL